MSKVKKALDDWKPIPEGTKVKLDMNKIKADVNYPRLTDQYKTWINENQDNVFTVEYDAKHMEIFEIKCDQCEMFEDCLFYKTCLVRDELIAGYLGRQ